MKHLNFFGQGNLFEAGTQFFRELNIPLNTIDEQAFDKEEILQNNYNASNEGHRLIDKIYLLGLTDENAFDLEESSMNRETLNNISADYEGLLVIAVELSLRENGLLPTRTQLADISRAFNREFMYIPVTILYRYGSYIALANSERLRYKVRYKEGEKVGKVSLLRDIDYLEPHTGHLQIMQGMVVPNKIKSFKELYKHWSEVFSVNVLNKKFYQELSNWYFWAIKNVKFPGEPTLEQAQIQQKDFKELKHEHNATNVIRMLTRILFVWFMKEKKLIPEELFDLEELQKEILNDINPYNQVGTLYAERNNDSIFYKAILQNLFFATLNCPIKSDAQDKRERGFRGDGYGTHQGVDYLMRYKKYFRNPEAFLERMNAVVPFLNGGLFECLDDKENKIIIDGFSDNEQIQKQLIVPDYLFFGLEENTDLSDVIGIADKKNKQAAVKGLINILKSYKFTITENTPVEEEVALDPELLGKVFENLLASYNPETKTTARKQTGSFYTPREIVNYMVDESLIAYLKNKVQTSEIVYKELGEGQTNLFGNEGKIGQTSLQVQHTGSEVKDEEEQLDQLLHELVSYNTENPFAQYPNTTKLLLKSLNECTILDPACGSGAFPMGALQKMVHVLEKLDPGNRVWKEVQIENAQQESGEAFYIADSKEREQRLEEINRAFDEQVNNPDYARKLFLIEHCIYGVDIQPIATQISKLRFFISLVVEQNIDKSQDNFGIRPLPNLETKFVAANTLIGIEKQQTLFTTDEVRGLEKELKLVRKKLFSARTKETKRKYRERDQELRRALAERLKEQGLPVASAEQLAIWDPFDQNASSPFFDPEWMFDINTGFDIVIGNPPYVSANNMSLLDRKKIIEQAYITLKGKWDIYIAFTEKSLEILNKKGVFTFIIPFGFLNQPYAETLRSLILKDYSLLSIVDMHNEKIFENATVPSCIPIIIKNKFDNYNVVIREFKNKIFYNKYDIDINKYRTSAQYMFRTENLNYISNILEEIKRDALFLDDLFYVSTGAEIHGKEKRGDNGLTISGTSKFELLSNQYEPGMKPYIEGSAIIKSKEGRYSHPKINTWLNYSKPNLMRSPKFKELFDNDKIILRRSSGLLRIIAIFDNRQIYTSEKCIIIIPRNKLLKSHSNYNSEIGQISLKYLLGLINSKVLDFYYASVFGGFIDVYPNNLKKLPIKINNLYFKSLLILVEMILSLKTQCLVNIKINLIDNVIDALVYNLYFAEHMQDLKIDVLSYIENDLEEVLQKREFEVLTDKEKEDVIDKLHKTWADPNNEVVKRMGQFKEKSPDILKVIMES